MPYNAIAANVLGTIGTVCWSGQILPQLWKTYREKDTHGLSAFLPFVWGLTSVPLGAYSIIQRLATPLVVQPQLFGVLCLSSWAQCMYYGRKWSRWKTIVSYLCLLAVMAGLQAGLVFAIRPAYNHGNDAPVIFLGVLSSVMIALGLVPQYMEIYRLGYVRGLSMPFIIIDCAGGVFNDLSLVWKGDFDILAGVAYSLVVVMDLAIVIAAVILNPRMERRLKEEASGDVEKKGPPVVAAKEERPSTATTAIANTALADGAIGCHMGINPEPEELVSLSDRSRRGGHISPPA